MVAALEKIQAEQDALTGGDGSTAGMPVIKQPSARQATAGWQSEVQRLKKKVDDLATNDWTTDEIDAGEMQQIETDIADVLEEARGEGLSPQALKRLERELRGSLDEVKTSRNPTLPGGPSMMNRMIQGAKQVPMPGLGNPLKFLPDGFGE
jgi:hypothetical protein